MECIEGNFSVQIEGPIRGDMLLDLLFTNTEKLHTKIKTGVTVLNYKRVDLELMRGRSFLL